MISGFVITSSLYERPFKNFNDFISGFYERRIKRLVPALSIFVLIMSIAICLFDPFAGTSLKTGLASLFGLSNIYLFQRSTDYFARSTELNVFTHTWSLGIEEQFYLLFPFLIWLSGFGRQTKNGVRNLLLTVGVLTISSLIGFIYLYPMNQPAAYFLMPTRFWEIASGCLLFIGFQKRKSIEKFLEKVPPILVLAFIIGVMYLPMSLATTSTVAVVVLSLVLIASLKKGTTAFTFFTNSKVVFVGLISYSLYLWHWGVLSISRWTIGIHWWSVPVQVALIFGLSIASFQYIETPLRKGNWFGKRWKTILVGGGVMVILSGGLIALGQPLKGQLYLGKKNQTATPTFLNQRGEVCLANVSKNTSCNFIDNKSQQTLWLLGDSHALSISLAGEKVANSLGMNLRSYFSVATPFPPVTKYLKSNNNEELQKLDDFKFIEKELYKQIKVGDIVLLSMRMPYHFGGTYYEFPPSDFVFIRKDGSFGSQENHFEEWIASVGNLANTAQKQGAKVIINTPTPEWEEELNNSCTKNEWFNISQKRNCQIESKFFIDEEKGIYKHLFEKLNRLSSSHKNIYLFDTYKILCPESTCSFIKNGFEIYGDDDHLSVGWARDFLAPEIYKFIKTIQ